MTELKLVYDFKNYRDYLRYKTEFGSHSRGLKKKLSEFMQCQATYLSQVLNEKCDLSTEQIFKMSEYFNLNQEEHKFLMLLHQKDRAGNSSVKKFFQNEIQIALEKRLNLSDRFSQKSTLSEQDRAVYYSSWLHMAVHFSVGFDGIDSRELLIQKFKLKPDKINSIVEFLLSIQVIKEEKGRLIEGLNKIWLGNDSPWIIRHHMNWRLRAIENLEKEDSLDLHYSSLVTLSESDVVKIKNTFLEVIKSNSAIIKDSVEEKMYVINIDFFNLLK